MRRLISRLNSFGNSFSAFEPSIVRMFLGGFLFFMGINFAGQTDVIVSMLDPIQLEPTKLFVAHYVIIGHISGGLLIAFGLITRIAALVQVPILIGAVTANAMIGDWMSLTLSIIVLAALIFYIIIGSSRISVDYTLKMHL